MDNSQSRNPHKKEPIQLSKFQFGSIIKLKDDIFNSHYQFPEHTLPEDIDNNALMHVNPKDMIGVVVSHIKRRRPGVSEPRVVQFQGRDNVEVVVALLDMKQTYDEVEANTNPKFFIILEDHIEKVNVSENFRRNFFENPEKFDIYRVKDFSTVSYRHLYPTNFNYYYDLEIPNNYNMDNLK